MTDDLRTTYSQLLRSLRQLRPDEHLCPLYHTQEEKVVEALAFIQIGLERAERCLYITDKDTAKAVSEAANSLGIDLDQARQSGALIFVETEQIQPEDECFDPQERLSFVADAIAEAREAGYAGFRWVGDMAWQLGKNPGTRRLIEFEIRLNDFLKEHNVSALCQYDRRSFSPEVILEAIRTHPVLIYRSRLCRNPYYIPPQDILEPNSADREVERHLEYIFDRERATAQLTYQAMLLEHVSDAVLAFDEHFVITSWNRAAEALYGWKAEEVLGRPLEETLRPLFVSMTHEEAIASLLRDGHLEAKVIQYRKDGGALRVEIRTMALRDESGQVTGYVCIHRDITESRKAEKALRQSQKRFKDLVETIGDWVWEVDARGVYTYASPRIRDLLGYAPQEVLGKTPFDLMPETEAKKMADHFRAIRKKREPFSDLQNTNRHKDGHLVVLESSGTPFFAEDGTLLGYRGVDRDITERKKIEEALRASDRMKSEFVSTAAHEFRTPLTSIQGYSELLLTKDDLPPEEREFLTYIHESAVDLSRIVADLLDITRIEEGRGLTLKIAPCPVREMFGKLAPFLKTKAAGHRFDVRMEGEDEMLMIDRGKIGQVLENLLSNATKYSSQGSLIKIRGKRASRTYKISITDQGIGMTPEQAEKMFDKFFRADASHTAVGGIGLGMSIVKNIVEAHGGHIRVKSEPGQGTKVTFTLSIAAEEPKEG